MPNTTEKTRILIAEDEVKLGKAVKEEIVRNGFEADLAYDGDLAEKLFSLKNYDAILLDINLPIRNGYELVKIFRKEKPNVPILMVTAFDDLQDKLEAFNVGADDYITKPFHMEELMARVKATLKRGATGVHTSNDIYEVGDLVLNVARKQVTRAGKPIHLTAKEFAIIKMFAAAPGIVFSKEEILDKVWNINFDTSTNTIEVYINFLRNKIDKPFDKKLIHTKQGFGYYMDDI